MVKETYFNEILTQLHLLCTNPLAHPCQPGENEGQRMQKRPFPVGNERFLMISVFLEKCHSHHTRTGVRADDAANERRVERVRLALPDVTAVLDVFFEVRIAQAAVAEDDRLVEVDAAALADLLHEQVVALLRPSRLTIT